MWSENLYFLYDLHCVDPYIYRNSKYAVSKVILKKFEIDFDMPKRNARVKSKLPWSVHLIQVKLSCCDNNLKLVVDRLT